jgi:hypothetical protein
MLAVRFAFPLPSKSNEVAIYKWHGAKETKEPLSKLASGRVDGDATEIRFCDHNNFLVSTSHGNVEFFTLSESSSSGSPGGDRKGSSGSGLKATLKPLALHVGAEVTAMELQSNELLTCGDDGTVCLTDLLSCKVPDTPFGFPPATPI